MRLFSVNVVVTLVLNGQLVLDGPQGDTAASERPVKDTHGEPKVEKEQVVLLDDWYINDDGGLEAMAHPAMIHQANYFTGNGKAFPGVAPIKLVQGETVRVRWPVARPSRYGQMATAAWLPYGHGPGSR